MADIFDANFAAITDVTTVVTAAGQTDILAECAKFLTLIPNPTAGVTSVHPDFDQIPPHTATKLRSEFALLTAAIDAAPTS